MLFGGAGILAVDSQGDGLGGWLSRRCRVWAGPFKAWLTDPSRVRLGATHSRTSLIP
ncbi:hypothetical protein GCM10009642_43500 [Nocardiopsis metallicus]